MTQTLREKQQPLKAMYRADAQSARITITARGNQTDTPLACGVDLGRAIYQAQAHAGVGGAGTAACSGDLLLGALAACAQLTTQMVAAAMGIQTERVAVTVEGDLDW
ncbi:MAG TPA: OsmC family protein, partial [Ktedonobacterales bacterium]